MSSDARTKTTIRIDNVHPSLTKDNLHDHFIPFGEIVEVEMATSGDAYAHIEYEEAADAAAALDNMHETELYERVITITPAKPTREVFEGLGSKVPLWEQEGFIARYMANDTAQDDGDAMQGLEKQAQSAGQADLPVAVGPMPASS